MFRRACGVVGVLVLTVCLTAPARAQTGDGATPSTTPAAASAWILVDADSGAVLAALNHRRPRYIASLVKVMTAYTALERLSPGSVVKISATAARQPAMRIGLQQGQRWKLKHLLHSLLLVSANDAAYALAEASGGSVGGFARQMQRTARHLGATDGTFLDPAGLDGTEGFRGGTTASAWDMAVVARNILTVPAMRKIVVKPTYEFRGGDGKPHNLRNHNRLLGMLPGATGLKTGYTKAAGHTFIGSARRDGRELIAVVLDATDAYGTASALIEQGFNTKPDTEGVGETLPDVVPRPETAAGENPVVAAAAEEAEGQGGGGFAPWRILQRPLAVLFLILFVLVQLRRRAVKRQRARRQARRRAYLEARRRGMLEVIDLDGFTPFERDHYDEWAPTGTDEWSRVP